VCGVATVLPDPELWEMATAQRHRAPAKARTQKAGRSKHGAAVLDAKLDVALAHTFPASDPVAIGGATGTEPPARPVDRQAAAFHPPDISRR
jgi:hypothetical protein